MNHTQLADQILESLVQKKVYMKNEFHKPKQINTFFLDDVLDTNIARKIHAAFPKKEDMKSKKSLREYKNIAVQMDNYDPILEEVIYAFQDSRIVKAIEEITGLKDLIPDDKLYAGGLSLMSEGNFLNPHLDNSHDKERENYRVLNLLYYVSPDWEEKFGGNLELWDEGVSKPGRTIHSKFNRLVVMITNQSSYHSVSKVIVDRSRCCVSNYYFSKLPAEENEYFHVTSFYGRPEEKVKDVILRADSAFRNLLRKIFKKGIVATKHYYDRKK